MSGLKGRRSGEWTLKTGWPNTPKTPRGAASDDPRVRGFPRVLFPEREAASAKMHAGIPGKAVPLFCTSNVFAKRYVLRVFKKNHPAYKDDTFSMNLSELTWPDIAGLTPHTPVVIPVAAMEQHGLHLPLATDSMLLDEIVRRVEPRVRDRVLFAPLQWMGNSDHHLEYAGTLSAGPRRYLDLLNDLMENLLEHGFRRIFFLNGHGGNITPGKQAVFEARQRHRKRRDLLLLFASYWDFAHPQRDRDDLVQSAVGHACEYETSMMLAIRPDLVKPYGALEARGTGYGFEPAYRGWITEERKPAGAGAPGHLGNPQSASAEKGQYLLSSYAAGVEAFLHRILEWDGSSWECA